MRSKLSAALLLALLVVGIVWTFTPAATATPQRAARDPGCCVTGDCCCPGHGDCCDLTVRAKVKVARKAPSCCETGDCCCPGHGSCCGASARAKGKSCCRK
jgi:hypothetical protein